MEDEGDLQAEKNHSKNKMSKSKSQILLKSRKKRVFDNHRHGDKGRSGF